MPNAALRWTPAADQVALEFRQLSSDSETKGSREEKPNAKSEKALSESQKRGVVWVRQGKFLEPVRVEIGASDGVLTEVRGDGLKEDMEVVLGQQTQTPGHTGSANPFIPQLGRGRGGGR
jgi:multidrug efflux pump subunit AcrA (membrane-fusion protein)